MFGIMKAILYRSDFFHMVKD